MANNGKPVRGVDVPIVRLIPRNERTVSKKYRQRIEATIRAVGLLEPLIVYPLGDDYEILDGALRIGWRQPLCSFVQAQAVDKTIQLQLAGGIRNMHTDCVCIRIQSDQQ